MGRKLYRDKYRTGSLRLPWWDYSENGDYFITIRTNKTGNVFGTICNNDIELNVRGKIVKKYLLEIPDHFINVILNAWVIMPDHVHLLLQINNKRNLVETQHRCVSNDENTETQRCCVSTKDHRINNKSRTFYKLKPGSIPVIIRSFKSICTREIHKIEKNTYFKWQRSFYDHVIFDEQVLQNIESYILNNPKNYHSK